MAEENDKEAVDDLKWREATRKIPLIAFIRFVMGALFMAALVFLSSFFQTGAQVEFTRFMSLIFFIFLCALGLVNSIWILFQLKKRPDL